MTWRLVWPGKCAVCTATVNVCTHTGLSKAFIQGTLHNYLINHCVLLYLNSATNPAKEKQCFRWCLWAINFKLRFDKEERHQWITARERDQVLQSKRRPCHKIMSRPTLKKLRKTPCMCRTDSLPWALSSFYSNFRFQY